MATDPPVTSQVRVGEYALEVGAETASFAHFEPERQDSRARALETALAKDVGEGDTLIAAVEEFEEDARAVTKRVERANELFRAAADGNLLDPGVLTKEIDTLLGVLGRLDRDGRFEEELRLARALHGLLALSLRWLDLIRSLRSVLRSAQAVGDQAGEAWARHELGSLHLCAGDPEAAEEHFREALQIEERLGDAAGRCATRHNLDSARRDLALNASRGGLRRRLMRVAGLAIVLVVAGVLGAAIARAVDGDTTTEFVVTTGGSVTTDTDTTSGTGGKTDAADTTSPAVTLDVPSDGAFVSTATPELSGNAGTAAGDQPLVRVSIFDAAGEPAGGAPLRAPVEGDAWTVVPTEPLPDGDYTARVEQLDESDNLGKSATTAFTVDTLAPVLTLSCASTPGTTAATPPTCTVSSTETGRVELIVNGIARDGTETELTSQVPTVDVEANVPGSLPFVLSEPPDPNVIVVQVIAVQRDAAGNEGQSDPFRFSR